MSEEPPIWVTEGSSLERDEIPAPRGDWDALYRYSASYYVARWEKKNGADRKRFSPLCWDGEEWKYKCLIMNGHRPLFRQDEFPQDASILLVGGEKAALAAQKYLPDGWFATCWSGGEAAPGLTDLTPLNGRRVVYWRDNDESGVKSVAKLREVLSDFAVIDPPLDFPDGWDLGDPLPDGITSSWATSTIAAARAQPRTKQKAPAPAPSPLTFDPIAWEGLNIPIRRWLVPDLIPMHVPTMLSGKGGLGKSLLGIQLGHAAVTRNKWLGRDVTPARTFAVFSEDDSDELHRRLNAVNQNTNTGFADLETMRLMIREGEQSSLMDFPSPYEAGTESSFFNILLGEIKSFGAQLIILDSLYNFFHGNENNRVQVSQFVYCLRRIAVECDAALVFIAHPSKSGITTGDGYAGSTAWHDAVRARLYLTEDQTEGDEPRLVLNTMKANYAPREGSIEVYYRAGMLWPRDEPAATDGGIFHTTKADTAFLACLRLAHEQGKNVSQSKNSVNFAPTIFMAMPPSSGLRRADFIEAMGRLFNDGKIKNGSYMTPQRKVRDGLYEVKSTSTARDENDDL